MVFLASSGYRFSPQTGVLRGTFPAFHVQYSVQENSPWVCILVCIEAKTVWDKNPRITPAHISTFMSPVKPSPSKKGRGGGQGGLRRAPTLGASTPLSHQAGQPGMDSRLAYYSQFKSTDLEADSGTSNNRCKYLRELLLHHSSVTYLFSSGVHSGRPDLVPRTPPLVENPDDSQANLSSSSLGSTGVASISPPLR